MADNNKSKILVFALTAFLLLAVLFGMQIMTFIFGQLGPENSGLTPGTVAFNISQANQNNSLQAINNYSSQAGTQFTVIGIAITLAVLILLFIIFWEAFMSDKGIATGAGKGGGNFA